MWDQEEVVAVLIADVHLSQMPPRCRRYEEDWFMAMRRPLQEVKNLASRYEVPVLCAGDVFHHWRAEPQLINFAIKNLPTMYAVPGQHDLPLHNLEMIERSAYWTVALADRIIPVEYGKPLQTDNGLILHGFPWGKPLTPLEEKTETKMHVALIHDYFWTGVHCFPGAPSDKECRRFAKQAVGYNALVFGDNHKGFLTKCGDVPAFNCGGMMRRASDEEKYEPQCGLLCRSGNIIIHKFNTLKDQFATTAEEVTDKKRKIDIQDFLAGLGDLQTISMDYVEALQFYIKKHQVADEVRKLILEAIDRE